MENINDNYFDGYYKDIWRSMIPSELTVKEIEFMLQYFNLQPGSKVLDLMCGYGRHALALGRKGIEVTAVDNLGDYIDEINEIVKKEDIPVRAIRANVIQYKANGLFDLSICMGNSLNFFNKKETILLLSAVALQLRKGGHLLIHTWSLAEIAIKEFVEKAWSNTINDLKYLSESQYLFQPTRIETQTIIMSKNGIMETKKAVDYIFSMAEMESMLDLAGFSLKEIYSIPGRKKFILGEPRAYIIAEKK
jgi:cyclopropane fatty-acyl-phospholipid synthase-like methyltransferase